MAKLNDKEQKIYLAVCQRFIAQFFPVCEYMSASLSITCEGENFKATGKTILKTGWKEIYAKENTSPLEADDNEDEEDEGDEDKKEKKSTSRKNNIKSKELGGISL